MTRWLGWSAALGLATSVVAYAMLMTVSIFHVRLIAMLMWPTALFLLANEDATSSAEVAVNFGAAIGGNVILYVVLGAVVFGVTSVARKLVRRGTHEV